MSEPTRNLWPVTKINVLSPIAILRQQATYLREATQGILEAEVAVVKGDPWTITSFWIIAPALDRYRFELFKIAHQYSDLYPVDVSCDGLFNDLREGDYSNLLVTNLETYNPFVNTYFELDHPPFEVPSGPMADTVRVVASSQDDFMLVLEKILASSRTERTLHSLIARTNDMGLEPVGR
jgi:hypothetical protein